jgi:hypothetical protein
MEVRYNVPDNIAEYLMSSFGFVFGYTQDNEYRVTEIKRITLLINISIGEVNNLSSQKEYS